MIRFLFFGLFFWTMAARAQGLRWRLCGDGGISWEVGVGDVHTDHIEMAGKGIAAIVTYGTSPSGRVVLKQHLVFPGLRKMPNDTRGSYALVLSDNVADSILVDGRLIEEKPVSFYIRGLLRSESRTQTPLVLQRTVFPSVDKRAYLEVYKLTNTGGAAMRVHVPVIHSDSVTNGRMEVGGPFVLTRRTYDAGDAVLLPGNSLSFSYVISM